MSLEENKAIVRCLFDAANTGNLAVLDNIMATDYVDNDALPGQPQGLKGYKQIFAYILNAFPDCKLTIDDMIAEGDKVVVRSTMRGTHKGEYLGIAPTGKEITATAINIYRIVDGKLLEEWSGARRSSPKPEEILKDC